jgi:ankyrin repeat protein
MEIFEAIRQGDSGAVERLVASEPALARSRNEGGISAVLWALYVGRPEIADTLARVDTTRPLDVFEAAALDRAGDVRSIIDARPDVVSARSVDGFTPLHLAAYFGAAEAAAVLADRGADVEAVADNDMGVRPLHSAAAGGHSEIVSLLLERGADADATQQHGWTALHAASERGDQAMVDVLLAAGADPDVPRPSALS